MKTARIWRGVLAYCAKKMNAQVAIEAGVSGLLADPVKKFELGWQDPFNLQSYNALFIVPDRLRLTRGELLVKAPIAIVIALRAATSPALADAMAVYADAIANIFEADPTAGGVAHEVLLDEFDFSLPAPGAPLVGALTVLGTVSVDQIYP